MKKPLMIITAIVAVLVGTGFIFPAVALMKNSGSLPTSEVGLLFLGTALTLAGCYIFAKALRLRRA
jgi:hypothetical protein